MAPSKFKPRNGSWPRLDWHRIYRINWGEISWRSRRDNCIQWRHPIQPLSWRYNSVQQTKQTKQTKQQVQEDQMLNLLKPGKCLSMCNAGNLDAARVGVYCLRVTWAVTCQRQENSKSEEDFESQTSRAVAHSASLPNCLHRVFHRAFHPVFASCVAMCFSPNSVLLGILNAFLRCPPWCWMVCSPSRGSCLPLSPIVPLLVSLCWMVCPPSRGSCLPSLP